MNRSTWTDPTFGHTYTSDQVVQARQLASIYRDRFEGNYQQRYERALFEACLDILKAAPLAAPMLCEQHYHLEWPHEECAGPGMYIQLPPSSTGEAK